MSTSILAQRLLYLPRLLSLLALIVGLLGVISTAVSAAGLPLRNVHGFVPDAGGFGTFEGVVRIDSLEVVPVGDGFVLAATGACGAP